MIVTLRKYFTSKRRYSLAIQMIKKIRTGRSKTMHEVCYSDVVSPATGGFRRRAAFGPTQPHVITRRLPRKSGSTPPLSARRLPANMGNTPQGLYSKITIFPSRTAGRGQEAANTSIPDFVLKDFEGRVKKVIEEEDRPRPLRRADHPHYAGRQASQVTRARCEVFGKTWKSQAQNQRRV